MVSRLTCSCLDTARKFCSTMANLVDNSPSVNAFWKTWNPFKNGGVVVNDTLVCALQQTLPKHESTQKWWTRMRETRQLPNARSLLTLAECKVGTMEDSMLCVLLSDPYACLVL